MSPVTAEQLAEWKTLADNATPGPWTTQKPALDAATGFAGGVIVAAVARGQGVYASPPGGSYPENDRRFIAAARTAVPALLAEVERLREAIDRYRYATQWTAADAWDFCSDCRERIRWAHAHDPDRLSVNEVADIGKAFLSAALPEEPADG